jgi:hypothetical protein
LCQTVAFILIDAAPFEATGEKRGVLQGSRRDERNQFPLAVLILDERLTASLDRRGRDRKHAVGLQRRMGDASDIPLF